MHYSISLSSHRHCKTGQQPGFNPGRPVQRLWRGQRGKCRIQGIYVRRIPPIQVASSVGRRFRVQNHDLQLQAKIPPNLGQTQAQLAMPPPRSSRAPEDIIDLQTICACLFLDGDRSVDRHHIAGNDVLFCRAYRLGSDIAVTA